MPIELSNIEEEVIEEDPDVADDIADILGEDAACEDIDSYTNEAIEENDTKMKIYLENCNLCIELGIIK